MYTLFLAEIIAFSFNTVNSTGEVAARSFPTYLTSTRYFPASKFGNITVIVRYYVIVI